MNVYQKIANLIAKANEITGQADGDLTGAIGSLIDGYGGDPVVQPLSVTENGVYTAPEGVDGYSPVTVNVAGGGATEPYIEEVYGTNDLVIAATMHGYTDIRPYLFWGQDLHDLPEMDDRINDIGAVAFNSNKNLALDEIDIDGIIGYNAFGNCTGLSSKLKIKCKGIANDGTSTTAGYAFGSCTSLEKVWLSKDIETIFTPSSSSTTFYQCSGITDIYTDAPSKPSGWGQYFNRIGSRSVTVHYGTSEAEFDAL